MRTRKPAIGILTGLLGILLSIPGVAAAQQDSVANAIYFWSNTCPYCHTVAQEHLPPIINRFGDRFRVFGVNVDGEAGYALYQAVVEHFALPRERIGVPTILVGETILMGVVEIPQRLPGILERGLAEGGIDWPPVPALRRALEASGVLESEEAAAARQAAEAAAAERARQEAAAAEEAERARQEAEAAERARQEAAAAEAAERARREAEREVVVAEPPEDTAVPPATPPVTVPPDDAAGQIGGALWSPEELRPPTIAERFAMDRRGNSVAVVVLLLLIIVTGRVLRTVLRQRTWPEARTGWAVPVLVVVGLPVALYLGLMELAGSPLVCGPVGNCNIVQSSEYAEIFGMPVGLLGVAGYLGIAAGWLLATRGPAPWRRPAAMALWGMALFGALFSIYLTFLEPFVIGASCAWCLTSALVMMFLLLAVTPREARRAGVELPR